MSVCRDAEGASLGRTSACPQAMLYLNTFIFFTWFSYALPIESG